MTATAPVFLNKEQLCLLADFVWNEVGCVKSGEEERVEFLETLRSVLEKAEASL